MLCYTHLVWSTDLAAFFGTDSWVSPEAAAAFYAEQVLTPDGQIELHSNPYYWSYLWWIDSPRLLWLTHLAGLLVMALLMLGLWTRVTSILAFVVAVSYVNRVPGALFGLDQINCMLAMYLMLGRSGDAYSLDRWLARRKSASPATAAAPPSVGTNIAIRLIQLHMCIIYFFAGLSKLQGETWWRGDALWGALANLEYQTLDMTWLAAYPVVIGLLTHTTVFWELFFPAIVWPRLLRPLVLIVAVPLHLGIAFCMGMVTFGLIMLVGCTSFIPPWLVRRVFGGQSSAGKAESLAEQGRGVPKSRSRRGTAATR